MASSCSISGNCVPLLEMVSPISQLSAELIYSDLDFLEEDDSVKLSQTAKVFHAIITNYTDIFRKFVGLSALPGYVRIPSQTGAVLFKHMPIHKMMQIGLKLFEQVEIRVVSKISVRQRMVVFSLELTYDYLQLEIEDPDLAKAAKAVMKMENFLGQRKFNEDILEACKISEDYLGRTVLHAVRDNHAKIAAVNPPQRTKRGPYELFS